MSKSKSRESRAAVREALPNGAADPGYPPLEVGSYREGKRLVPFWVLVSARKQLRMLAAERDTTMQACMIEALNDFFCKHGKPPIA
jgi:hypothetical protein